MKKFLFLLVVICSSLSLAFADPIMELAAPRLETPHAISGAGTAEASKPAQPSVKTKAKGKKIKGRNLKRKIRKQKPKVVKLDYNKLSKYVEYGYYDEADRILASAIDRNPKDIQAQSLYVISLAKQFKLDPAQDRLNYLLKKYPDNANLHYAQGLVYYQQSSSSNMFYRSNIKNLLNNAQKEFKKAVALDKNNAGAYNALGVVSIKLNNPKDAKNYFQKALVADNTYSMALDNLGTIDYTNGKIDDAQKKFKSALDYNSQNTTAMYHLAQIAFRKGDYKTVLNYLNDALFLNQNSPAIYNLMGKAYAAQGNEAAAINAFKKSLSVRPEFTLSYLDLAEIYEKRGDNDFAIEQLKTAVSIEPDFYDAILKIADISLLNGNYKQAISFYSQLVGVDGYNDNALKGLGNSYFGQAQVCANKSEFGSNKDLFKALNYISKAVAANNKDLEMHLAKLKLEQITNQPEQTKITLNKIINSPDEDLMSMVVKGEAYITLNDYKNAQKSFDKAVQLSKNEQDNLYLSEILIYHKQYDSAQKVLSNILKSDPNNQEALSSLDYIQKSKKSADNYFSSAQKFINSRNTSMAMEYLSRSLAFNPNNAQAHFLLAQIYEKKKDYPGAVANYNAYLSLQPNSFNAKRIKRKVKKLDNKSDNKL